MIILTLDSSVVKTSGAISQDNKILHYEEINRIHGTESLLELIEHLLQIVDISLKQIDLIGVTNGPGSFTGVRIVLSIVKAFSFSLDIPIIGVSSLATLAQRVQFNLNEQMIPIIPIIDARINQYYFGIYKREKDQIIKLQDDAVTPIRRLTINSEIKEFVLIGGGYKTFQDMQKIFPNYSIKYIDHISPRAIEIIPLALQIFSNNRLIEADNLLPVYL